MPLLSLLFRPHGRCYEINVCRRRVLNDGPACTDARASRGLRSRRYAPAAARPRRPVPAPSGGCGEGQLASGAGARHLRPRPRTASPRPRSPSTRGRARACSCPNAGGRCGRKARRRLPQSAYDRQGPVPHYGRQRPPPSLLTSGFLEPSGAVCCVAAVRARPACRGGSELLRTGRAVAGASRPPSSRRAPRRRPVQRRPCCDSLLFSSCGGASRAAATARSPAAVPGPRPPPRLRASPGRGWPSGPPSGWEGEAEGRAPRAPWRPPWERAEEPAPEVREAALRWPVGPGRVGPGRAPAQVARPPPAGEAASPSGPAAWRRTARPRRGP